MTADGSTPAIRVASLSKTFRLPHEARSTVREYVLHPLRRTTWEEQRALSEVTFEVGAGEFFGVIGRNGSGKSTLLKLLARIYRPDSGTVEINGKLSPFIELGVGFHPELNARDNIRINGTMLGLAPEELDERFDEIIGFAELERFVDQKLKNYSSGMQLRLAYSIAIQVPFDILLLDEVLAVGDQNFQEKCFATFDAMRAVGKTVVLVTHGLPMVTRFCDRALLLRDGVVQSIGPPDEVTKTYVEQERRRATKAVNGRVGARSSAETKSANPAAERASTDVLARRAEMLSREEIALLSPQQVYEIIGSQHARLDEVADLRAELKWLRRSVDLLWHMVETFRDRHYPDIPMPPAPLRARMGSEPSEVNFLAQGLFASERALEVFGTSPSGPVLEWGCGPGRTLRWLLAHPDWRRFYRGCDPDEESVQWLGSLGQSQIDLCGDDPPLPYADGAFEGVLALSMLTRLHPERHQAWYAELARVVRPGGLVCVCTFGPSMAAGGRVAGDRAREELARNGWTYVERSPTSISFTDERFIRARVEDRFAVESVHERGHRAADLYLLRRLAEEGA